MQEIAEKLLKLLIQIRPDQYDSLFQRLRITDPEQRQQWLARASEYKQQLIQQQQQQHIKQQQLVQQQQQGM